MTYSFGEPRYSKPDENYVPHGFDVDSFILEVSVKDIAHLGELTSNQEAGFIVRYPYKTHNGNPKWLCVTSKPIVILVPVDFKSAIIEAATNLRVFFERDDYLSKASFHRDGVVWASILEMAGINFVLIVQVAQKMPFDTFWAKYFAYSVQSTHTRIDIAYHVSSAQLGGPPRSIPLLAFGYSPQWTEGANEARFCLEQYPRCPQSESFAGSVTLRPNAGNKESSYWLSVNSIAKVVLYPIITHLLRTLFPHSILGPCYYPGSHWERQRLKYFIQKAYEVLSQSYDVIGGLRVETTLSGKDLHRWKKADFTAHTWEYVLGQLLENRGDFGSWVFIDDHTLNNSILSMYQLAIKAGTFQYDGNSLNREIQVIVS